MPSTSDCALDSKSPRLFSNMAFITLPISFNAIFSGSLFFFPKNVIHTSLIIDSTSIKYYADVSLHNAQRHKYLNN